MYLQHKFIGLVQLFSDIFLIIVSFLAASLLMGKPIPYEIISSHYFSLFCLITVWFFSSHSIKIYDDFHSKSFSIELMAVIKMVFVQFIAIIIILYLLNEMFLSRTFSFIYALILLTTVSTYKFFFRKILYMLRKKGRNLRNVLIIGADEIGKNFYDFLKDNPQLGYQLAGFLDNEKRAYLNGQYLGKIIDLENILLNKMIDKVIVALPTYQAHEIEEITRVCDRYTTRLVIIPDYIRFVSDRYQLSMFGGFPVINVREDRQNEYHWRLAKRIFDFVFSTIIITGLLSWLVPIIAVVIKISSPGPVFYKQERWGKNNKKFIAYKFRSMRVTINEDKNAFQQATKNDPRVTNVGKFLRKTNIDELPQFLNVLKGEMSIVGPRPHPTPLNLESKDKIDLYMVRHFVKPGLTGWAQVNGFRGETKDDSLMKKRVGYDLWYIENWSVWLDVQIVLLTVWRMVAGDSNAY